jgi:dolichol-phosphate mannosyltransferase
MDEKAGGDPSISVVVPVYGCIGCLETLCEKLEYQLSFLTSRFEIILVDDRSPDLAWTSIPNLQREYHSVIGVRLSRNYGQHIAITAGLAAAKGDLVVVMDCDLQDPPEMIPDLYNKINEGYDLVLGRRVERNHSAFRNIASSIYFNVLSRFSGKKIDGSYGSFSILRRKVVDAFLLFEEKERHYIFILKWLGFRMGEIEFAHNKRYSGESSYGVGKLLEHAINGAMFQATVLLRWIVGLGFIFSAGGFASAAFIAWRAIYRAALPGWTSLAVLILVGTGVVLMSLGIVGLYVGKIFEQTKQRPLYVIDMVLDRKLKW